MIIVVCSARYAALPQCLCGSTNSSFIFSSSRYCLTSFEATLSMMLNTGLESLFVRYVVFSLNVAIVKVSVRSFTGVTNISFDEQSYSTKIYVFLSFDLIVYFPVSISF